ncbi:MAG: WG repeat-containing protein [Crocinitomicaceae bacterium]|nr:WG repeat-containing protein [Crocinitomicaceae bacterium]
MTTYNSFGGKLGKAFEALEIYNYFEAKRLFEKSIKNHPVPAAYGLSIIYARRDNPFSNLDSAYSMIYKSFQAYPSTKEKLKLNYEKKLGIDSVAVVKQRDLISDLIYRRAKETNSVFAFQDFIDKNKWSNDLDSAIYLRDELAFNLAVESGGSKDFEDFLKNYKESFFYQQAEELLHETLYKEQTANNTFVDYVNFVKNYPESPYRGQAEDKVYEISTKTGTAESYRAFIIEFPGNRNIKSAWKHLYNAKMMEEYSSRNIKAFKEEYPDYPYQKELLAESNMADKIFLPIKHKGLWGFCDLSGNVVIEPKYESVEVFSEGLTAAKVGEHFGYLNKLGNLAIPPAFDDALSFSEGHALVEVNGLLGMIDRNGDFVIPAKYEDLGILKSGLAYYQEEDLYGYFDSKGKVRLTPQFSEAFDFEGNYAVVSMNDFYGVIDQFGTTFLPFKFDEIFQYDSTHFVAYLDEYWGVIGLQKDTLIPFEYDYIGKPDNGMTMVELDDEFNYFLQDSTFLLDVWAETFPEYRQLARFTNGYAKIKYEDGYNLIDKDGKKLFKKNQEDLGRFGELIPHKKKGVWGYVDKAGTTKIDHEYTYANSFQGEFAIIQQDPFYGLINRKGEFVVGPLMEDLKKLNDTLFVGKSLGKYGLISTKGDTLLNFQYIKIEPIDDTVVMIEEEGEIYYYNIKRLEFLRKED